MYCVDFLNLLDDKNVNLCLCALINKLRITSPDTIAYRRSMIMGVVKEPGILIKAHRTICMHVPAVQQEAVWNAIATMEESDDMMKILIGIKV